MNGTTITQSIEYTDANQIESMSYSQTGSNGNAFLYNWTRSYDKFGRVIKETEPDSNPNATTSKQNVYNYDAAGRLSSNTTTSYAGCNLNSYSYDTAGNRLTKTEGNCTTQTTQSHSYNSFSQLTSIGYSYDALGRNTLIPSIDTPNGNGAITLAYNTNDQVTQISQAGSTTNFTYEAEGRRLNETISGQTTTRHYNDSGDNPAWTTQTGANGKTEIYSPALGTGLNVTTTIQNGTQTGSMQLHDLRGNTVTTIDLTTNTASAWSSYDEYGNPETTNPSNTNNINYSTYGQAERATNTTGLILMGARVYNPQTNQFTSPDPVKVGNENSYTYPNDPTNKSDYFGAKGHSSSGSDIGGIDDVFRILALIQSNVGKSILQGVTKDIGKLKPVVEMFLDRGKPGTTIKVVPGAPGEIHIKSYDRNGVVKKTVRVGVKGENYKIPGAHILNFQSGRKKGPNDAHVQTSFPSGDVKSLFSYLDEEENGAIYGTH